MTTAAHRPTGPEGITTNVSWEGKPNADAAIRIEEAVQIMNRPDAARAAYDAGNIYDQPAPRVSIEVDIIDAGPNALSRVGDIATVFATCGGLTITAEVEISEPHAGMIERAIEVVGEVAGHEQVNL